MDETIGIWNAHTGNAIKQFLHGHKSAVTTVAFSPEEPWIASGSRDTTVCIWDRASGQFSTVGPLFCHSAVTAVAFSPGGRHLAACDSEHIHLWHANTDQLFNEPLHTDNDYTESLCFTADGAQIVSAGSDRRVCIWNTGTAKLVRTLEGHTSRVRSVASSCDGRYIGSGSDDYTVRLWDAKTGAPVVTLYGHAHSVESIAFIPKQRSIMSCSFDETIRIWNIEKVLSAPSEEAEVGIAVLASTDLRRGWLLGPQGELLLWVPSEYQGNLSLPHTTLISKRRITVSADAGELHAGEDWTSCW